MEEEEKNGEDTYLKKTLEQIAEEIKISWQRDVDRTEYMIKLINILKDIFTKDSLEEYFSNNQDTLNYFMNDFMKTVIQYILIQPIIYGNDGDEIALELLLNIIKLFMKFHKNTKYSPLFEKIRDIFQGNISRYFFNSQDQRNQNPIKKYNYMQFNKAYNSEFEKKIEKKIFKVGEEVDFPLEKTNVMMNHIEQKNWTRGKIIEILENDYLIEYGGDNPIKISKDNYNIFPSGTKTTDWEWRTNLKKYDLVDCYERSRWYPSTIFRVAENDKNGVKVVKYKVGFRLYPDHYKNPEDENDTYDKHLDIWKQYCSSISFCRDSEDQRYVGDQEGYDELIDHYSKKIQKYNTFSKCQQKYINYSYGQSENNPMQRMNEKLKHDTDILVDDFYNYKLDGKKNCIIGKEEDFQIYYGVLLKKMENEKFFEKIMEILQDNPNAEEIFNICYILLYSFPYIHRDYFKENINTIKNSLNCFINNLDEKEMRNLQNLKQIVKDLLKKISDTFSGGEEDSQGFTDLYDEIITFSLPLKFIKASIFSFRLDGIKELNEYIENNQNNEEKCAKIIKAIKENGILQEIFGANYHSQIISKSKELVKLLLLKNELSEEDIKLIWSCTKRGDLEAKVTIMKLLSELSSNLREDYVEMLLKSILENVETKINYEEIELVYKLSTNSKANESNKKNILICCDYLCQCLLTFNDNKLDNNPILNDLLDIVQKDDIYLEKVLDLCQNCLKQNKKSLLIYSLLFKIFEKTFWTCEPIEKIKQNDNLLNLFKVNFKLYIKQAKEILEKNKISPSDGDSIDKSIIDGFTHLDNVVQRIEIFSQLIKNYYKEYDYLPFLKEVLITNAVSPNDQKIFYEFLEKNLFNYDSACVNAVEGEENEKMKKQKDKIMQELFELLADDNQNEITEEQFKLFRKIFRDMNKDNQYNYLDDDYLDKIKGLDKLWNITFQIKDEKVLTIAVELICETYNKALKGQEKLLQKCINLIKDDNSKQEIRDKNIFILKLLIRDSEKYCFLKTRPHLSLLKNCLINMPLQYSLESRKLSADNRKYRDKFIFTGNTTINDLRLLLGNLYDLPPDSLRFLLSNEYLQEIKENKNIKNKDIYEKYLDDSNNNDSLYELLLINKNLIKNLSPDKKIELMASKQPQAALMISGELTPKFKNILKEWFREFTNGTMKMGNKELIVCFKKTTGSQSHYDEDDYKIVSIMDKYDQNKKGYLDEDDFLNFYLQALLDNKTETVWENLNNMNIREDLQKMGDPYDINYNSNEKLPRYELGNDFSFVQKLMQNYNKNPSESSTILEFLLFLSTNEKIYNEVLNMYNEDNKDSFVNKCLKEENTYMEHNYIFMIIESFFQDLELYLLTNNKDSNDIIDLAGNEYKLLKNNYEPFDSKENHEKKINFLKNFIKPENFDKIVQYVNKLLEKIGNTENKENQFTSLWIDCCLRGLKIIKLIDNFSTDNEKEKHNCLNELNNTYVYRLGHYNLSSLLKDCDINKELNNYSYIDLANHLINYLNNEEKSDDKKNKDEKSKCIYEICLNLLLNLLSTKSKLCQEYTTKKENKKNILVDLFKNYFINSSSNNEKSFIFRKLEKSIINAEVKNNNDYILFLFQICNSLLDYLLNFEEESKEEATKKFSPNKRFFDIYKKLYKRIEKKQKEEKNIIISDSDNSFIEKIYNLLMKGFSEKNNKEKKQDDKFLLSLLKIFAIFLSFDTELKNEILFKEKNGEQLFSLLFNKCVSQINIDSNKSSMNQKNQAIIENKENEEEKFICLDTLKEDKKNESDSSTEELNELCNTILLDGFNSSKDQKVIKKLVEIINLIIENIKKNKNGNDSDDDDKGITIMSSAACLQQNSTKQCGHVGLKNLGCICYLNSIMQQIYMVPTFRYAIMHADDGESANPYMNYRHSINDDNLLHQLQIMYTYLTFSEKMDYNPRDFCYSFKDMDGNPINIGSQQDSQEFYNNFCDKIENKLKKTNYKYIVNDVFTGRTCSSVLCQECKHISNRFEDFYNLTLEVKNINTLNDSLQKLIVPEIIDDFKCSNCNKNVRISKITSLSKLPNVLVIHLKRFYLDYEICHTRKINTRLEFPQKINLKSFCVEEITKNLGGKFEETTDIYNKEDEYYQYELKGINVHTGSADGGHYFSYIDVNRDGKNNIMNKDHENENKWLTFNDSYVSEFDINSIPSECFGGNNAGLPYENCQNAYLLIYERKKKAPIRIIVDEKEVQCISEDSIIKFDKEKRDEIKKEYDLSRIGNNKNEEEMYKKIFYDIERKEYYKYIPYYNLPRYTFRKIYNQVMKDNNITPTVKSKNTKYSYKLRKFQEILLNKANEKDFDINNYNSNNQINIISILFNSFMKKVNQDKKDITEEDLNNEMHLIIDNTIKPIINQEKDIDIEILPTIIKILTEEELINKLYGISRDLFSKNTDLLFSSENAKMFCEIYYELLLKLLKLIDKPNYSEKFQVLLKALFKLIKKSNTQNCIVFNNKENTIIYIYKIIYKLITTNEAILSKCIENKIISILFSKITEEKEEIRKIIYDILLYIIKKLKEYNKTLFDLEEGEEEGKHSFVDKDELMSNLEEKMIYLLFEEKKELFDLFLIIFEYNNEIFMTTFNHYLRKLLAKFQNKKKEEDLLNLLFSLIKINDKCAFRRLYNILGYAQLVVRPIPREKKKQKNNSTSFWNTQSYDYYKEDDNKEEGDKTEKVVKQKWPIFGANLMNGDIMKQVYEYTSPERRKKYNICLLSILFPSEYTYLDEEEDKKKEKEKKSEEDDFFSHRMNNNDDDEIKRVKIEISEELKKIMLLKILNNCFGPRNNYPLFKYIYLMPSRTIFYKNLYEEIITYLKEDKNINLEKYHEKEEKYIKQIEKELKLVFEIAKKNDIKNEKRKKINEGEEEEEINYEQNEDINDIKELEEDQEFNCFDENIKLYYGLISDIIPGEVVREEITEIATKNQCLCMFRLDYYTKYYKIEELRNQLLNEKNKKKEEKKKNENETEKEKENTNEENENKKGKDNQTKEDNVEEEKLDVEEIKIENDEEEKNGDEKKEEEKKEEEKKEEEKKEEKKKEEEKKEDEKKEDEKKEDEKKEDEKKEEEKKEEIKEDEKKEEEKKEEEKKEEKREESKKEEIKEESKKEEKKEEIKEEEIVENEINDVLKQKKNTKFLNVSEKNENSFIYGLLDRYTKYVILDDDSVTNRNKTLRTLVRFIFFTEDCSRVFNAKLKEKQTPRKVITSEYLNFFKPKVINDFVDKNDISNFIFIHRLRKDLPFFQNDIIAIEINFE